MRVVAHSRAHEHASVALPRVCVCVCVDRLSLSLANDARFSDRTEQGTPSSHSQRSALPHSMAKPSPPLPPPPLLLLDELPTDVILSEILSRLVDFADCAALALAHPRLGVSALRDKASATTAAFRDPLFAIAVGLWLPESESAATTAASASFPRRPLSESRLVRYAHHPGASVTNFWWIEKTSPYLFLRSFASAYPDGCGGHKRSWSWSLCHRSTPDYAFKVISVVRRDLATGSSVCYKGEVGHERIVHILDSNGSIYYYSGERASERIACVSRPDGAVCHYDGESGFERKVSRVFGDRVEHYEGARGFERRV